MRQINAKGFSVVMVVVAIVVGAALAFGGWYVWEKDQDDTKDNKQGNSSQNNTKEPNNNQNEQPDPYQGWEAYTNNQYGIGFRYPAEWHVESVEGSTESPSESAPLVVGHAINLKRAEQVKYNDTASLEIYNGSFEQVLGWYEDALSGFQKTVSNQAGFSVTEFSLKATGEEKVYLLDVQGRAYGLRSLNETTNLQFDSAYWAKFNKLLQSLTITAQ